MMRINAVEQNGTPIAGADVLVNDEPVGQTPNASKKVSNFVGTDTEITVSKAGYHMVRKGTVDEFKIANLVLGVFLNWFAFLWINGPKSQQTVILIPEEAPADAK
jgi:hypothetical protein